MVNLDKFKFASSNILDGITKNLCNILGIKTTQTLCNYLGRVIRVDFNHAIEKVQTCLEHVVVVNWIREKLEFGGLERCYQVKALKWIWYSRHVVWVQVVQYKYMQSSFILMTPPSGASHVWSCLKVVREFRFGFGLA
ncbi:hypothetical protein CR513_49868, partial [Mucuna pruriens]